MIIAYDSPSGPLDLACEEVAGRMNAETVLFLHGFGHRKGVWQGAIDRLSDRWRRIAIDLRGHGESPWSPTCAYGLDDYAQDIEPFLDARGIDRVHVVAHSMGGQIALIFAAAHPDRVRSLTLVDTGPSLRAEGAAHVLDEVGSAFRVYAKTDDYRRVLSQLHPFVESSLLDAMVRGGLARRIDGRFELALDPGVSGAGLNVSVAGTQKRADEKSEREARLWASFRELDIPMLVMRGRLSSVLTEESARAMERVGGGVCKLVQVEGVGHAIMIDACSDFSTELSEFLGRLDSPKGGQHREPCRAS